MNEPTAFSPPARSGFARVRADLATPLLLVALRCGGAGAAFGISLLMARTMDAASMGVALTCLSVAPLAAVVVSGSTEAGCVRFIVGYRERGETDKARGMISFNRWVVLTLGSALLGVALIVAAAMALSGRMDDPRLATTVLLTVATAVVLGWLRIAAAHVMALGAVVRSLAPFSFLRQALLLLGLSIWVWTGATPDAADVVFLAFAGAGIALAVQAGLNRTPLRSLGVGPADRSDRAEWVKVGLQLGLALLFVQFSRDLTLVVSAASLAPEDVAVLGIATAIVGFAKFYVVAVNQSITPELSRTIARQDMDAFLRRVSSSNHLKFWPMLLALLALWLLGDRLAAVFGPDFADMTPILLILMLEPLALAWCGPGGNYLSLSGHQRVMLPLSVATILLLGAAVTLGALVDGTRGAAIGSSLAWVFWSTALAVQASRRAGHGLTLVSSIRRDLAR